jgi:elongation factor Ts
MSALDVKQLRMKTGAGFMDCKKALEASSGDIEQAMTWLKEKGIAKAASKSGRATGEGIIVVALSDNQSHGVLVEVNCETDFVAKNEDFLSFTKAVGALAIASKVTTLDALLSSQMEDGHSVEEGRQALVAKIGENCQIRRMAALSAPQGGMIGHYQHGVHIGVLVALSQPNASLGRDLAMHIAANRPMAVNADAVPKAIIDKERAIFIAQAEETGKPKDIQDRMVEGKVKKFLVEQTLEGQAFVKDPDTIVKALLDQHQVVVTDFVAYYVGGDK